MVFKASWWRAIRSASTYLANTGLWNIHDQFLIACNIISSYDDVAEEDQEQVAALATDLWWAFA